MAVCEIESVKEISRYQLCVTTKIPFGKTSLVEMILEAPSEVVRERWESNLGMVQLEQMAENSDTASPRPGSGLGDDTLLAEGYLIKVQESLLALSRSRCVASLPSCVETRPPGDAVRRALRLGSTSVESWRRVM